MQYVGIAHSEGFRVRIRNKHATGSEDRSHKFSAAYNTGRLWRDRHSEIIDEGRIAKRLRNRFILEHCTASVVEIAQYDSKAALESLERRIIALASPAETTWNRSFTATDEPAELVDALIDELRLPLSDREALNRQKIRYLEEAK